MYAPFINRSLIAAVGVFAVSSLFALAPSSASAQSVSPDASSVLGTPAITTSSPLGYYLWRDMADNRVHVDTHGPGGEHHFVAQLTTVGTFEAIDGSRLEPSDSYQLLDGGHELQLDFDTYQYTDDITFTVAGADHMHLNLMLDGSPISTGSIYIGPASWNPAGNPFGLWV